MNNLVDNIDIIIVISFLVINLIVGLYSGRSIKTIKEYAIGNRNFSTTAITATIIATWIGSGFFSSVISETYHNGLWHIVARFGDFLTLLIVGVIFAPRVSEFFGKITVAEIMNDLYGSKVRTITAIASIALSIGYVAVQIKVFSNLFSYFFGISYVYAILIGSSVIIIYSTFGGIKAVTLTDMIQFFTFGVFIPTFAFFLWAMFGSAESVFHTLKNNPLFDYTQVFDYNNKNFYISLILFFYFTIPALDPATIQRILMAKNTTQVKKAFVNSSILCLLLGGMGCLIGLIALSHNPNLNPDDLLPYVIDNYYFTGLKGITLMAVMAMGMSTADSYINASAVIFSYDLCKPFKINFITNYLLVSRIFALVIGAIAVLLVLYSNDLFELLLLAGNFYTPIVTVPLMLAILGFRSTSKSVLVGMVIGLITVILWRRYIQSQTNIDSIIPGTIANLLALLLTHYISKQPGGWIGVKNPNPLIALRLERKRKLNKLFKTIKEFNLLDFFRNNLPKEESTYSVFSLFIMISTYSSMYMIPEETKTQYRTIYDFFYHSVFIISCAFLVYPILPKKVKNKNFIAIFWHVSVFYLLIYVGNVLMIISSFNNLQSMGFVLNLIAIGILFNWQIGLMMVIFGTLLTFFNYQQYMVNDTNSSIDLLDNLKLKIIYILFMISGFLLTFLKPRQQQEKITELKVSKLDNKLGDQKLELIRSHELKDEFLRNLQHEIRTPVTGITGIGQVLWDNYDKLTEEERRSAIKEIAESSERLVSLVNNMVDLSKLKSLTYELSCTKVNLSELIYQRLEICRKIYLNDKELKFIYDIQDNVMVNCDKHYITSTLDNLITNAISYSQEGTITVSLRKEENFVKFNIIDEGVGIPPQELHHIFGTFVVSSRTKTPSGGRGLGLALCKKVIEAHKGQIWCESDGKNGSSFTFVIPYTQ